MAPWRSRHAVSLCCLSRPKSWSLDHTGAHAGAGVSGLGAAGIVGIVHWHAELLVGLGLLLIHLHGG